MSAAVGGVGSVDERAPAREETLLAEVPGAGIPRCDFCRVPLPHIAARGVDPGVVFCSEGCTSLDALAGGKAPTAEEIRCEREAEDREVSAFDLLAYDDDELPETSRGGAL